MTHTGTVIAVYRGGCDVVHADRVHALQLIGRQAHREQALAVGDQVEFDAERGTVLELLPRRTWLARRRSHGPPRDHVIAANLDRVAIVAAITRPPFRPGAVDRFLLAAFAGGMQALLVANKLDLLEGAALPEEVTAYAEVVPVIATSAVTGQGLDALRDALARSTTVLAGHSGVGKSSLLNALEPELRLETRDVNPKTGRGRHTTTAATWLRLAGDAIVVDTPGVREIASGPVDPALLDSVYPDVARAAEACRFRDCRHDAEPDCGVRAALSAGELSASRVRNHARLVAELPGA